MTPGHHPTGENSSDKENKSESVIKFATQSVTSMDKKPDPIQPEQIVVIANDDLQQDDNSDEGWQEAFPKGRSPSGRKSSTSRRPSLAKLNTNFMSGSQPSSRYRGKPTNFTSPRTTSNESVASAGPAPPVTRKLIKSASFSPKLKNSTTAHAVTEKSGNAKSAPATPASTDQVAKPAQVLGSVSVKAAGKLFSYKEVALAPPGSIVKAVTEQLPEEDCAEQGPQVSEEGSITEDTHEMQLKGAEDGKAGKPQKPSVNALLMVSNEEMKGTVIEEEAKEEDENSFAAESRRKLKFAVAGDQKVEVDTATEINDISVEGTEAQSVAVSRTESSDSSKNTDTTTVNVEIMGTKIKKFPGTSSDSGSTYVVVDNTTLSTDKDASAPIDVKSDQQGKSIDVTTGTGDFDPLTDVEKQGNEFSNPLTGATEKQGDADSGREIPKKLSAAAPPFNPSSVQVFGSVNIPGLKDQGGILPPPVNIPPMLAVNPVRRSPHQSATSRVPYGPRLSGGYNRSGNRVPRNKPAFHNGEHTMDGSHFIPPIIMNPHAAEFVPSQAWVPNGYPIAPNGYLVSSNGYPLSPNGYPAPLTSIPATQTVSPVSPEDSPKVVTVEVGAQSESEVETEERNEKSSCDDDNLNPDVANAQAQSGVDVQTDKFGDTEIGENEHVEKSDQHKVGEISHPVLEVPADKVPPFSEVAATKENCIKVSVEEGPSKRWGDYSDGESDIIEVS